MSIIIARRAFACACLFVLVLGGCASSPPQAKYAGSAAANSVVLQSNDGVALAVSAAPGVTMADYEKTRLGDQIKAKLAARQALNAAAAESRKYDIDVTVTRYEKGNAFARAMLAGLGQIHLDALIKIFDTASHTLLSEFRMDKTFAWGGIYGGTTSMEDIEGTFAEGLANAVSGGEKNAKAGSTADRSAVSQK